MRRLLAYCLLATSLFVMNVATVAFFVYHNSAPSAAGGSSSECALGDINGDENSTVGDVVYLLNYLFLNGPEPIRCAAQDLSTLLHWPPAPEAIVNICGEETIDFDESDTHTVYTVPDGYRFVVTQCFVEGHHACAGSYPFSPVDLVVNGSHLTMGSNSFVLNSGDKLDLTIKTLYNCTSPSDVSLRWFVQGFLADAKTGEYPVGDFVPNPKDMVYFAGAGTWNSAGDSKVVYTVPDGKRLVLTEFELPYTTWSEMQLTDGNNHGGETLRFMQFGSGARDTQGGPTSSAYGFNWDNGHEMPLFFDSGSDVILRRADVPYAYYPTAGDYFGGGYLIDSE